MGQDPCVLGNPCVICDGFSDIQREKLATPSYKIIKECKTELLVSPKGVTVLGSLDAEEQDFDTSAQVSAQPSVSASPASSQPQSFVTAQQFEAMNDKWAEQFRSFAVKWKRLYNTKDCSFYDPFSFFSFHSAFYQPFCPTYRSGSASGR